MRDLRAAKAGQQGPDPAYPEGTVTKRGVISDGVPLLVTPYAVGELLRRVRAVLDSAA